MPENVILKVEDRDFSSKAKRKMQEIRENYNKDYIETGKSQELERKIDEKAKKTKKTVKVLGGIATVALTFCPADGPFGEICAALATPGVCALVDLVADIKKKILITGKRFVERYFLKVDGRDENIAAYDMNSGEIVEDVRNLVDGIQEISGRSK